MGTFYVDCTIENVAERTRRATVSKLLVDTGSVHTWAPASVLEGIGIKLEKKDLTFVMANGQTVTRSTGFAVIRTGDAFTVDEVVFAEDGDLLLLGPTKSWLQLGRCPRRRRLHLLSGGKTPCERRFTGTVDGTGHRRSIDKL